MAREADPVDHLEILDRTDTVVYRVHLGNPRSLEMGLEHIAKLRKAEEGLEESRLYLDNMEETIKEYQKKY